MDELSFHLGSYDGPLDLLLKLIAKNKVSIYDIPIALILDQYMAYLEAMRVMDMDIAGEFITTAAELMLIKSRMLLPKQPGPEEEDPRAKLAEALAEYKRAKETAALLGERFRVYDGRITKEPEVIETETILGEHSSDMLECAFRRIIARGRDKFEQVVSTPERTLGGLLAQRPVSVAGYTFGIMRRLLRFGDTDLERIILSCRSRSEVIAAFVATLELLRSQRVSMEQVDGGGDLNYILHLNREKRRTDKETNDG